MMFQDNNTRHDSDMFSLAMQRRMDMMLQNANKLFSLGWLRKRLWKEFVNLIGETPATEYGNYSRVLLGGYERRFMWEYLSVCQKSISDLKRILENAYDDTDPLKELLEEREELIREFARMPLSKTWECVKNDNHSWRNFARRLPFADFSRKEDITRFFLILDRISVITDILCRKAKEYGLEVDYSLLDTYDVQEQRKQISDEVLIEALKSVGSFLTTDSTWTAVYCVLRDDYGIQNQSQFERDVQKFGLKKLAKCPDGTVSRTIANNVYLSLSIEDWPSDKKFTKLAAALREAIKAELAK